MIVHGLALDLLQQKVVSCATHTMLLPPRFPTSMPAVYLFASILSTKAPGGTVIRVLFFRQSQQKHPQWAFTQ